MKRFLKNKLITKNMKSVSVIFTFLLLVFPNVMTAQQDSTAVSRSVQGDACKSKHDSITWNKELEGIVIKAQKQLIKRCRLLGRRVITATEMLESMINNPRPTRAEISDVANAVYDGSSAIMLSGESAAGKYPVEAVQTMSQVAEYTEMHINYKERFAKQEFNMRNNLDAISHATCQMAIDVGAKAIVVHSRSGVTARMVSRFRCPIDIIGMTTSERIWREGDNVVMTGGLINGKAGNTNTIKVETVN